MEWESSKGQKDLDIPVLREVLLFGGRVFSGSWLFGKLCCIMASELNDLMNSLTFCLAIEGITGVDIAPKWMEDDVIGAWEAVKGAGDYAVRLCDR